MKEYAISPEVVALVEGCKKEVQPRLDAIMERAEMHQYRVIRAMQNARLSDAHFHTATGYGYDDVGREVVETIYAEVFGAQEALVRPHISSGTHAISLCLYGVLRPGDELLAITGAPYDTINTVIGTQEGDNGNGTLKDFGIDYKQVDLVDGHIDRKARPHRPRFRGYLDYQKNIRHDVRRRIQGKASHLLLRRAGRNDSIHGPHDPHQKTHRQHWKTHSLCHC